MLISYWTYIHLCLVINNQRHYTYIFDRLGYMSTLTYWSFCFPYQFFDAAQIGYKVVSVVIIPRI